MGKVNSKVIVAIVLVVLLGGVTGLYFYLSSRQNAAVDDVETVANPPEGCPSSTSIVVQSEEAGTQNITTSNSNFLHWRDDQALLIFSNYTVDLEDIYSNITEGRVLTVIKLTHNDSARLTAGTYSKATTVNSEEVTLYAPEFNISTVDLAGGVFDNNATVEVTYFGDDYVCGTVTSDDGSSSINGDFIARYTDQIQD